METAELHRGSRAQIMEQQHMHDGSGTSCVLLDLKSLRNNGNRAYEFWVTINDEPVCGVAAQHPWIGRMLGVGEQLPSANGKVLGLGPC